MSMDGMSEAGSSRPASEAGDLPSKEAHKKGRFKVRCTVIAFAPLAMTRSLPMPMICTERWGQSRLPMPRGAASWPAQREGCIKQDVVRVSTDHAEAVYCHWLMQLALCADCGG